MVKAKKKRKKPQNGLGRGLDSLIGTPHFDTLKNNIVDVEIQNLRTGIGQPRKNFNESNLQELAESIRETGVIQPLLVRDTDGTHTTYEIIAGERRYRAAKIVSLQTLPCIVMKIDDTTAHEVALIENIQREDLNPMEEALGYQKIIDTFGYTQDQMAQKVGKSRSHIANVLRLLNLPQQVQHHISDGNISLGHAKVLVGVENAPSLAKKIIDENMNVRETEKYVKKLKRKTPLKPSPAIDGDIHTLKKTQEQLLSQLYKRSVAIKINAKGAGKITLSFNNKHDLNALLEMLANMREA